MFERYTESARRALFFARYEVTELGASTIAPEHLLLGLTRENRGILPRIFEEVGLAPAQVRQELRNRLQSWEKFPVTVEIPFSAATKRALQYAAEEAEALQHSYIGTEHLLLALLRDGQSLAASILMAHGLSLEGVRAAVPRLLTGNAAPSDGPDVQALLVGLRDAARELEDRLPPGTEERALAVRLTTGLDELWGKL